MTLILKYWRAVIAVGAVAFLAWQLHAYGERKADAREAEIRQLWKDDIAQRDAVSDLQRIENEAKEKTNAEAAKAAWSWYEARVATERGRADRTYRLLQRAEGEIRRLTASQAVDPGGTAQTSGTPSYDDLRRAIAELRAEAGRNAARLDAVVLAVTPQL